MKRLVLAAVLSIASIASAADLINGDTRAYNFTLIDGSVSSSKSIRGRGSMYGLCTPSSSCKIVLNGKASAPFNSNSRLKIEGGNVKVQ